MDSAKIGGIVRAVLAPVIAYAAGRGILVDNETGELVIVAVSAVVTAVWSLWTKRQAA